MFRFLPSSSFNSLPDDKILDWSKLKAFADDKLKLAKIMVLVLNRVENIVGKGENAGFQHFLPLPCFGFVPLPLLSLYQTTKF